MVEVQRHAQGASLLRVERITHIPVSYTHLDVYKRQGLLTEAGPQPAPDVARRWCRHILDSFGAWRVLWGSDWPVLELAASYADWWHEVQAQLQHLGEPERAAVLGGNARRVYGLN